MNQSLTKKLQTGSIMNKTSLVSILFLLISFFSSCTLIQHTAGKRHIIGSIKQADSAKAAAQMTHSFIGPVYEKNAIDSVTLSPANEAKRKLAAELKPLWQRQYEFTNFVGKAKMRYQEGDNEKEFTAHIRIRKDSVIWVNITALGGMLPVAKLLITNDSLVMVNLIDREVTTMPLSQAAKLLPAPADFSTLQNFIVGQALRKSGAITDATDFGGTLTIQVEDSDYIQQIAYNKADSTMRSAQMSTYKPNGPQGIMQYGNYGIVKDRKFAFGRSLHLQNAGVIHILDMDFSQVDFDTAVDFPFSIPKSFSVNPRK